MSATIFRRSLRASRIAVRRDLADSSNDEPEPSEEERADLHALLEGEPDPDDDAMAELATPGPTELEPGEESEPEQPRIKPTSGHFR